MDEIDPGEELVHYSTTTRMSLTVTISGELEVIDNSSLRVGVGVKPGPTNRRSIKRPRATGWPGSEGQEERTPETISTHADKTD